MNNLQTSIPHTLPPLTPTHTLTHTHTHRGMHTVFNFPSESSNQVQVFVSVGYDKSISVCVRMSTHV